MDYAHRVTCNDAMMVSVLSLDYTDKELKRQYNLSLVDFQQHPKLVQDLLKESVMKQKFDLMRIGTRRYGKDGEVNEGYAVGQVVNGSIQYVIGTDFTTSDSNENSKFEDILRISTINEPVWRTSNGKAPKDLSFVEKRQITCIEAEISISIIAFVFSIYQLIGVKFWRTFPFATKLFKWTFLVGCLLLNLSTVLLMSGSVYFPNVECRFRPFFFVIGLAFVNGTLLAMSYQCRLESLFHRHETRNPNRSNRSNLALVRNSLAPYISANRRSFKKEDKRISFVSQVSGKGLTITFPKTTNQWMKFVLFTLTTAISFAIAIFWVALDRPDIQMKTSETEFDFKKDSFFQEIEMECSSSSTTYWVLAILIFNVVITCCSSWLAYYAKRSSKSKEPAIKALFTTVIQTLTLMLAISAVMSIISSKNQCTQHIVFSVSTLVFSILLHLTMCLPRKI